MGGARSPLRDTPARCGAQPTENGTWLARRNGQTFYTGNSAWLTSDEEVRLVTSPMVATICHALTVGWLRPTLELLDGQDPRRFMVWFSTDNLSLRPDKSQDARALHDAGILSEGLRCGKTGSTPTRTPPATTRKRNAGSSR